VHARELTLHFEMDKRRTEPDLVSNSCPELVSRVEVVDMGFYLLNCN